MANLYGRLQGARGEATRIGHTNIRAKLETWNGSVEVVLEKDGAFTVRIGDKYSPRQVVASGNVDTGTVDVLNPGPNMPGSVGQTDESGKMVWT